MTKSTTAIFTITIMLLVLAASLIPFTKILVTSQVMRNAGTLKAITKPSNPSFSAAVQGSFAKEVGM